MHVRERKPSRPSSNPPQREVGIGAKDSLGSTFSLSHLCQSLLFAVAIVSFSLILFAILFRSPAPRVETRDIENAGNHWVMLEGGRLLEYAKCGDPKGLPLYAATGYASTASFFTASWMCKLYERHGLRVISISMPGFGLSDSMPIGFKRSLRDWPEDVLSVMDKEQVKDFAVFGWSTGCVHGAAVAAAFPDRIAGMLLSTPTAPATIEATCDGIAKETAAIKKALGTAYIGDLIAKLLSMLSGRTQASATPDVWNALRKMEALGGQWAQILEHHVAELERASAHTYRGLADNMHTIVDDIPFSLGELGDRLAARGIKMGITTAPDDTTNPPAMQEWFHSELKGSEMLHFDAGWGHLHVHDPGNFDRMLAFLAQ